MNRYPNYALANLPWLYEIPAHWSLERNKIIFQETKDTVGENASKYPLLSLTKNGIIPRDMASGKGKFPKDFDTYKKVGIGDMAFCLFDIDETPRTVGLSGYDGMLTGAYTIFHVRNINSRYAYYYYLSLDNVKAMRPLYSGLRKTINVDTFLGTKIPIPPREEQDQIVRFLDWKVSGINKLIGTYQKEILYLEELEKNIIDGAVINGVHDVETVHNDDVRWDINYPPHWKLQRIRESFTFRKGLSITKANLEESGIAVISYGQVHSKRNSGVGLNSDLIRFVNKSYLVSNPSSLVKKGDFIFADTSEDVIGCGNCVYIDWDDKIFAGYHSIIAHPCGTMNQKYLAYLFRSPTWRYQIRKKVNGVKVYSITQMMLKDAFILIPPHKEQDEIVAYLDENCTRIEKLISETNKKINQLMDLKIRIVADAVTGEIDVRSIEIPEYEYVGEEAGLSDDDIEDEGIEEIEEQED